jgi:hypothetical protein
MKEERKYEYEKDTRFQVSVYNGCCAGLHNIKI